MCHLHCRPVYFAQDTLTSKLLIERSGSSVLWHSQPSPIQFVPTLFSSPSRILSVGNLERWFPAVSKMETAEVVLDINQELVSSSMSRMLDARNHPRESIALPFTIYKVPDEIKNVDSGAYEPQIVSIGPFHNGYPRFHLHPMEAIKWQFLHDLIDRDPSNSIDKYINAVSNPSFVREITECYSVPVIGADGVNAFVETLVLDGCFIIEFFLKSFLGSSMGELDEGKRNRSQVMSDLLLIENQIPFSVVQVLFNSTSGSGLEIHNPMFKSFANLAADCWLQGRVPADILSDIPEGIHHLLHLCHTCIVRTEIPALPSWSVNQLIRHMIAWALTVLSCWRKAPHKAFREPRLIGSATELYKAGISFKRKRLPECILDVTFRAIEGVMEIPLLSVDASTVSMWRNMVALEHLLPAAGNRFTSFAALMDILVDAPADVDLLVKSGVIENKLESREDVTYFFNTLGKGTFLTYDKHYLKQLIEDVNEYCAEERHRYRASFMHTYFSNPWTAISLFAAVLLLLLTILQTFFTVYSYFRPP